jgi:YidC/Oxa1 family membrane protein insertase
MEKRIIIAFILSFGVLYAFRAFYAPSETAKTPNTAASVPVTATPPNAEEPKSPEPTPTPTPAVTESPATEIQSDKIENVTVDTPLYTAVITNVGAVLKSYKLKAYSDGKGQPLELINAPSGEKVGWPLAVETDDTSLNGTLSKAFFVARQDGDHVTLEFAGGGVRARKELQFDRENYEFSFQSLLTKDGKNIPHSVVWQAGFGDQSLNPDPVRDNVLHQVDANFTKVSLRNIKDVQMFASARVGVEDQYFLAMYLFDNPVNAKAHKQEFPGADGNPVPTFHLSGPMPEGKPIRVYVGPKDRDWLAKADPQLSTVINYGWFEFISKPLLFVLLLIHSYIGNFGWSIIILTIAINLLLFPLKLKQQLSMLKMQKIQPQMRTLQDKYKKLKANDPRRAQLQTEMMGLYKEHGVNPLGGCLPLLLQLPVFYGLYSMLSISIELRRAPWALWITDLSQADPYYILPILLAVSMFIIQKMTPTTVDPAQAKMMMIMPVMFAFMFLRAQAGLTLYWMAGNLVGIGQQIFINKYWSPQAEAKLQSNKQPKESNDK